MQTTLRVLSVAIIAAHILQENVCQDMSELGYIHYNVDSQCIEEDVYRCSQGGWFCVPTESQPVCTGLNECPESYAIECALLGKQCVTEWGRPGCRSLKSIDLLPAVPSQCPEGSADTCAMVGARCVLKGDMPACIQPHEKPIAYDYISPCSEENVRKCAFEKKACILPDSRRQCAVVSQCPQELQKRCAETQTHCIRINNVPICDGGATRLMNTTEQPEAPISDISSCEQEDAKKCALQQKDCIIYYDRPECTVVSQCPKELDGKCAEDRKNCFLINDVPVCEGANPSLKKLMGELTPTAPSQCLPEYIKYCGKENQFCILTSGGPACTSVSMCKADGAMKCALVGMQCNLMLEVEFCADLVTIPWLPTEATDALTEKPDGPEAVTMPSDETPTTPHYRSPCPQERVKECTSNLKDCILVNDKPECAVVSRCPRELEKKCLENSKNCILINAVPLCEGGMPRLETPPDAQGGHLTPPAPSQCNLDDDRHCDKEGRFCVLIHGMPACLDISRCQDEMTKKCALMSEQCVVNTGTEGCAAIKHPDWAHSVSDKGFSTPTGPPENMTTPGGVLPQKCRDRLQRKCQNINMNCLVISDTPVCLAGD